MKKLVIMRIAGRVISLLIFLLVGNQALASNVPIIYYEDFANQSTWPFALIAGNSKGEFFLLNTSANTIIKLDNDLNEIKRWIIPFLGWFNEIAIDNSDNVWISSPLSKLFRKFDGQGNYLDTIVVRTGLRGGTADLEFVFDQEGNIYFINTGTLFKVDPNTGTIIKKWTVPVGGPTNWHRGMAINSKGELFWGVAQSPEIYMFSPQTEESKLFALLPVPGGALQLAIDSNDNLYVIPDGYSSLAIQMFDGQGNYVGAKALKYGNLCSGFEGFGITTFADEIVVTGFSENLVVKYTSNKENSKEQLYKCYGPTDAIPPITTLIPYGSIGANNWYITDVQVTLTSVDNEGGSGVKNTEYSFDGATWNTYSAPFTITNEGIMTIYYKSTDNAGNVETTKSTSIKLDKTSPTTSVIISGASGNNGWYKSDANINLISSDNSSGSREIHYILDGAETVISGSTANLTIAADGRHSLSYWAIDNAGNIEQAKSVEIMIDKTPPVLSVTANPGLLWPPNHKYVTVIPSLTASDAHSGIADAKLLSVVSNEPDNGLGDGDTSNDIVINPDGTILLRAERSGTGNGRVYTITYKATDLAGNVTVTSATVVVPHDMRK